MFDNVSTSTVESELVATAGHLAAGTCRFLQLLGEFAERGGWAGPGMRSCAHWLNWRVGMSLRTARDHLRVAHALRTLPAVTEAFAAGRISYSKVRALTRIATPATEVSQLKIALHGTTSQLESLVAATRAATTGPRPATARRAFRCSRAADGSLLVSIRVPAEQGAALLAAIDAHVAAQSSPSGSSPGDDSGGSAEPPGPPERATDAEGGREKAGKEDALARAAEQAPGAVADPAGARRLDALLDLVTGRATASTATVVVHMRAEPVEADPTHPDRPTHAGAAWIEGGPALPPTTAERLACGATVQALVVDRRGNPLYVGRTRRTATPRQMRALHARHNSRCAFPGCTATHHLQAHHVRWWGRGGRTDVDNLVLLCTFHHTLIHDEGYVVTARPARTSRRARAGGAAPAFVFARPDGTPVPVTGPAVGGAVDALVAAHARRRLAIDDRTITPNWAGERLDRNHVLAWLLPELGKEATAPVADAA